jgi:hypothetical protein
MNFLQIKVDGELMLLNLAQVETIKETEHGGCHIRTRSGYLMPTETSYESIVKVFNDAKMLSSTKN